MVALLFVVVVASITSTPAAAFQQYVDYSAQLMLQDYLPTDRDIVQQRDTDYLTHLTLHNDTPIESAETRQQSVDHFAQLRQNFETGNIFTASFEHEYLDTFTGESQHTEGTIWIGKDRYKIISGANVMVVDGEVSHVYDSLKNRIIISNYVEEDDDFAPSRMLQGVDDSYEISQTTNGGKPEIRLVTDDSFAVFTDVIIQLSEQVIPQKITATDQVENELTTQFYGGSFITPSDNLFRFPQPEGAEIIDLRDSQ